MGDRVYVKSEARRNASQNPKLVTEWEGPYRVVEMGTTTATLTEEIRQERGGGYCGPVG